MMTMKITMMNSHYPPPPTPTRHKKKYKKATKEGKKYNFLLLHVVFT
jgi:hypothetical protein